MDQIGNKYVVPVQDRSGKNRAIPLWRLSRFLDRASVDTLMEQRRFEGITTIAFKEEQIKNRLHTIRVILQEM